MLLTFAYNKNVFSTGCVRLREQRIQMYDYRQRIIVQYLLLQRVQMEKICVLCVDIIVKDGGALLDVRNDYLCTFLFA